MGKEILTPRQKSFLDIISSSEELTNVYYLTGGTALAAFYLNHRRSEDLDFFSERLVDPQEILVFLKTHKKELRYKEIDTQHTFNRNMFFLKFYDKKTLKVEFNYYPYQLIGKPKKYGHLKIDSLDDIAINKTFTIAQNPRTRDFIDLYLIIQKTGWKFKQLLKDARNKFDWYIDPLQVGTNLMKATMTADYPRMVVKIDDDEWRSFFLDMARKLKGKIIEGEKVSTHHPELIPAGIFSFLDTGKKKS